VLADARSREAIAIDTATPCFDWLTGALEERGWTLRLIVSTHGHWDHIGDNAALAGHTGADIAVHPADRAMLEAPAPVFAPPFELVPSVPAVELAEGGEVRFGDVCLTVLHTPGHTPGSVCLLDRDEGVLYSGDTLFAGGWGRTDLPGGDADVIAGSIARLTDLEDRVTVHPGHGPSTTIGRERAWMDLVRRTGRVPF
jgi:glyoxylase-like metal-dependent hydrolase (beta-lactamase superfamily II)